MAYSENKCYHPNPVWVLYPMTQVSFNGFEGYSFDDLYNLKTAPFYFARCNCTDSVQVHRSQICFFSNHCMTSKSLDRTPKLNSDDYSCFWNRLLCTEFWQNGSFLRLFCPKTEDRSGSAGVFRVMNASYPRLASVL